MAKEKVEGKKAGLKTVEFLSSPKFRMSFPHLFKKHTYQGKETGYQVDALIPKTADLTEFKKLMTKAKVLEFGKDQAKWPKVTSCLKDGDKREDLDKYSDYAGHYYITMKAKNRRPLIVDKNKEEVDDESEVYPGRWAKAAGVLAVTKSGKDYYLSCYMNALQLGADAEPFGGGGVDKNNLFNDNDVDDADDESNYEDSDDTDSDNEEY